eukprot:3293757-Rhodomonas_salina.1
MFGTDLGSTPRLLLAYAAFPLACYVMSCTDLRAGCLELRVAASSLNSPTPQLNHSQSVPLFPPSAEDKTAAASAGGGGGAEGERKAESGAGKDWATGAFNGSFNGAKAKNGAGTAAVCLCLCVFLSVCWPHGEIKGLTPRSW